MKQLNILKKLFIAALLIGVAGSVNGQTIAYPLAFGPHTLAGSATLSNPNWYKNYVGLRFEVTTPAVIAGEKDYTTSNDGSGTTGQWGGVLTTPLINVPVFMDTTSDSFGTASGAELSLADIATITSTTPHMIVVLWRGPEGASGIQFECKAACALASGASAVVLINEFAGQPPVGMGVGTSCTIPTSPAGPTIPVFMMSNPDGIALSAQYHAGVPVKMTITPWGANNTNDLGIIPGGGAFWQNFAIPSNQLSSNVAFNQEDGAFIANFGTSNATNVTLQSNMTFTPNGGSSTPVHSGSVTFSASTPLATYPFTAADSILAMFSGAEYPLTGTGNGRYDITYTVSTPDYIDQNLADNSITYSFYTTDSLYSKGRYDFVNNKPFFSTYEAFGTEGTEFIWGPMYFVGPTAGTAIQAVQYALSQNSTATVPGTVTFPSGGTSNVFIFKWVDGSGGQALDSIVQDGELTLVSTSTYTFDGVNDTTGALLQINRNEALSSTNYIGDASGDKRTVFLDPNSWYYVAADVPASGTSTGFFLGVDNITSPYPRIYGRYHTSNGYLDYNNFVGDAVDLTTSPVANPNFPCASAGTSFVNAVDSFVFFDAKLIPSVALLANNHPDTVGEGIAAVKNINQSPISLSVYPNPASDYLDVSVNLDQPAKTLSYEVIDGMGRFVSRVNHYNVQTEVYQMPTTCLPSGNYYMVVNANGAIQTRKFTVVR